MNDIKILDVTLRDGGCVNDFDFGNKYMKKILFALENSKIDIIELGYIDDKYGSATDRTKYINEKVIYENFLLEKKGDISYVVMMDFGKFDVNNLECRNKKGIDGIRLAFHKKNMLDMIQQAKIILEKGYDLYIQPMITMRYSDRDLLKLIEFVNEELPSAKAFYIVDSFGEMKSYDVIRIMNLIDHNLYKDISVGFHSHNNLQMSYSNAMTLIEYNTQRNIIIDSSIMGMGKGAGNLNTELIIEEINTRSGKKYEKHFLLDVMDKVVEPLHSEYNWGYSVEYYLSAINGCTPSYASHFYKKHTMSIEQLGDLLAYIDEKKKISFDKEYAESIYKEYNEREEVDDRKSLQRIKEDTIGKNVIIVAPGKSVEREKERIIKELNGHNIISFGLNIIEDFDFDYVVITRKDLLDISMKLNKKIIVPSNLIQYTDNENVLIIDYKRWIDEREQIHDSSSVLLLNILVHIGTHNILLAGFDGFSSNITSNYYDYSLRNSLDEEQANNRNKYYKELISQIKNKGVDISFLTESLYC